VGEDGNQTSTKLTDKCERCLETAKTVVSVSKLTDKCEHLGTESASEDPSSGPSSGVLLLPEEPRHGHKKTPGTKRQNTGRNCQYFFGGSFGGQVLGQTKSSKKVAGFSADLARWVPVRDGGGGGGASAVERAEVLCDGR